MADTANPSADSLHRRAFLVSASLSLFSFGCGSDRRQSFRHSNPMCSALNGAVGYSFRPAALGTELSLEFREPGTYRAQLFFAGRGAVQLEEERALPADGHVPEDLIGTAELVQLVKTTKQSIEIVNVERLRGLDDNAVNRNLAVSSLSDTKGCLQRFSATDCTVHVAADTGSIGLDKPDMTIVRAQFPASYAQVMRVIEDGKDIQIARLSLTNGRVAPSGAGW